MKQKHHVSTTISAKHWAMLKKHAEKYDTHQKVLELALEGLDNGLKYGPRLSKEEELWMHIGRDIKSACIIPKDAYKELLATADIERFKKFLISNKPLEYVLEDYYQKPLKECSLLEIIEGIVIMGKVTNSFDIINYVDKGDHYTLKITHEMNVKHSKIIDIMIDSAFKTYGARIESNISERSLFIKIFKNV